MPTEKQTEAQLAKAAVPIKQHLVHHVCHTAMHIIHDSYLPKTNLWPKNGMRVGWGIGCPNKDTIFYGVNVYEWDQTPVKGVLKFNIWNTRERRSLHQALHIKRILDYAYLNDLYFEDHGRNTRFDTDPSFIFTYTPTTK